MEAVMTRSSTVPLEKSGRITIASAVLALGVAAATYAAAEQAGSGRYTMQKTDGGFVRLDTQTGAVSLCQKSGGSWSCRDITNSQGQIENGNRAGSAGEMARLRRENQELKDEIARLEELLGLREPSDAPPASRNGFKLPSEKDVDQAFDYFESMLRKFQERLKRLEREQAPETERKL